MDESVEIQDGNGKTIRVLLADDHEVVRTGLRTWLEGHAGIAVIAEASSGTETVEKAKELTPDIVIMDVTMPGGGGIEATRRIATDLPNVKVIALSIHSDKRYVARMLTVGARGYLQKDCAFKEMVQAIHSVLSDQIYISPVIAGPDVLEYIREIRTAEYADPFKLAPIEQEILRMVAAGKTTKEIAEACFLSIKAIERYRHIIMEKLDLHSIAELTKYALSEGLTFLE